MQLFNEHFGQGTASLDYVTNDMPADAYIAWWHYFNQYSGQAELRKAQKDHDDVMGAVRDALKPR